MKRGLIFLDPTPARLSDQAAGFGSDLGPDLRSSDSEKQHRDLDRVVGGAVHRLR